MQKIVKFIKAMFRAFKLWQLKQNDKKWSKAEGLWNPNVKKYKKPEKDFLKGEWKPEDDKCSNTGAMSSKGPEIPLSVKECKETPKAKKGESFTPKEKK